MNCSLGIEPESQNPKLINLNKSNILYLQLHFMLCVVMNRYLPIAWAVLSWMSFRFLITSGKGFNLIILL